MYELSRTEFETDINDYNPEMLLAWNGNIDVQYIGEDTGAVANYIVSYITKAEMSHNEEMWEEIGRITIYKRSAWQSAPKIETIFDLPCNFSRRNAKRGLLL